MALTGEPYIPQYITVHLGYPDSDAQNVTVTFPDYIKNVASSEIYPTWPENAIRANIYVQVSYALNRYYTEWYRSRGYDFDITNTTQYDQAYVHGRNIFENVSQLVDELFNNYVRRQGTVEPYFTAFCNGTTSKCDGLSQWGTVDLANQGMTPYEILQYYYGDDIDIVSAPVRNGEPSYPGFPLGPGLQSNDVRTIQIQLNRISRNYPAIPKISNTRGIYAQETENAVREFQQIFDLPVTGIVDKATWYRISYLFVAVKRLSELDSEGLQLEEISRQYPDELREGQQGNFVKAFQYFLAVIGQFYDSVPPIQVDGYFGPKTAEAVRAFQRTYGLPETGVVDIATWNDVHRAYLGIVSSVPLEGGVAYYPGVTLSLGSRGEAVRTLQLYLSTIADTYTEIPKIAVDGIYGPATRDAVYTFQRVFGLPIDGIVGPLVWYGIADVYATLALGQNRRTGQNPGQELKEES